MSLTILNVAYPLASVSADATGGSEQVLGRLDHALTVAGHASIVVAPRGSRIEGTLVPIERRAGPLDDAARASAQAATAAAIEQARRRYAIDLIHLHGIDFSAYLPAPGLPVLATLHLPPSWYPPEALSPQRPDTWLNGVSASQARSCPPGVALVDTIENGVPVEALAARYGKRDFLLFLGRICPEKGVHHAIDAAKRAGRPLLVAGELYGYEAHRHYFETMVAPRLDRLRRYIGPVGFVRKRRLLTAARALLIPSLAPETSSLVAREAAACGTAVVAFPNGALAETVLHGRTGFLVADEAAMADAIANCPQISPETCRTLARTRFSETGMTDRYLALYDRLARRVPGAPP